jgi:hypothetical protein
MAVLTTCETARGVNWDIALQRGYTLVPKPPAVVKARLLLPPPFGAIAGKAWRSRRERHGLIAAFFAERAEALDAVRRENERREADVTLARERWVAQSQHAMRAFRERHQ